MHDDHLKFYEQTVSMKVKAGIRGVKLFAKIIKNLKHNLKRQSCKFAPYYIVARFGEILMFSARKLCTLCRNFEFTLAFFSIT